MAVATIGSHHWVNKKYRNQYSVVWQLIFEELLTKHILSFESLRIHYMLYSGAARH